VSKGQKSRRPVGTVWRIETTTPVSIRRPAGVEVTVAPGPDGHATHVLDVPGEYVAGDETITVS
jgi:hypothetical protein